MSSIEEMKIDFGLKLCDVQDSIKYTKDDIMTLTLMTVDDPKDEAAVEKKFNEIYQLLCVDSVKSNQKMRERLLLEKQGGLKYKVLKWIRNLIKF